MYHRRALYSYYNPYNTIIIQRILKSFWNVLFDLKSDSADAEIVTDYIVDRTIKRIIATNTDQQNGHSLIISMTNIMWAKKEIIIIFSHPKLTMYTECLTNSRTT